jgi:hypothetical protein
MTLVIDLKPEEEARLRQAAAIRGMSAEELALQAVKSVLAPASVEERLARLATVMDIGDEEEQRETWEYLKRVLDEDRLSDRKLFP